jgi:hypothetical protein
MLAAEVVLAIHQPPLRVLVVLVVVEMVQTSPLVLVVRQIPAAAVVAVATKQVIGAAAQAAQAS